MRTSPMRAAIVGLLAAALAVASWGGLSALAQNGAGPIIRPYAVRHRTPEEAADLLRKRAAGLPEAIEISIDPATGTLLVRGSAAAQTFLGETLKQFDQPPAPPVAANAGAAAQGAQPPLAEAAPVAKILPYALSPQDLPKGVELAESLAAGREDVRFTIDARTSQLLVSAPQDFHQALRQRIDALAPAGAAAPQGMDFPPAYNAPAAHMAPAQGDFVPAENVDVQSAPAPNVAAQTMPQRNAEGSQPPLAKAPAAPASAAPAAGTPGPQMAGTTLRLQHTTIDGLAQLIRDQWGTALPTARDEQGGKTVIKMGGAQGSAGWIILDHVGGTVSIQGTAPAVAAWEKVVRGLDVPVSNQQASTLLRVERADPVQVRQAVNFLGYAHDGDVAAALPAGAAPNARFVAQNQPAPNQPGAAPVAPPAAQPAPNGAAQPAPAGDIPRFGESGPVAPGDAAQNFADASGEAGTIGPVRIEFVEGLDVIIIRGNPADVARVTKLIQELDRLSETTQPRVEVHLLENVSSEPLAALVTEVYDTILSPRQGQVVIRPLGKPNAILLIGRAESVEVVKQLIDQLDQPVIPAASFRVFRMKHMSAVDAATRLTTFYEERGGLGVTVTIVPDYRSNSVIVQAGPRDMQELAQVLESIDVVEAGAVNEARVFRLTNAVASDLAPILQDALNGQLRGAGQGRTAGAGGQQVIPTQQVGGGATGDNSSAQLASQMLTFLQVDPEGKKMLRSGITFSVRVTADVNSNSLVVTGPSETMDLIGALIGALDQLPDVEAQVKVFTIVNGDAESLVATLDTLFGTGSTAGGGGGGGGFGQTGTSGLNQFGSAAAIASGSTEGTVAPLRFAVDARSNSIVASGSPGSLDIVERVLIRLDESTDEARTTTVYRLRNAPAEEIAEAINTWIEQRSELLTNDPRLLSVIQQVERQLIVVAEPITNSLIVSATSRFYDDVVALIEQLDSRPPMVEIQVLIAEVSLNDFEEFGIELGLQNGFLINNPLGGTPSGKQFNDTNPLGQNGISGFGLGTTSSTAGYPGLVLSAGNESISVLLRTLQDQQRLQVLSKPKVMTLDNQEAFVQVGQRVPRVTAISQNTGGGTTSETELDDVGILLGVRPRTSPDGLVVMEVNIEKSSVGPASQGIPIFVGADGTTINSPIYNVTNAETVVSARSGQTIVISGLITKSNSTVSRKIPYLSDVPVLGRLFRYDLEDNDRTELMIVLTPYIVSRQEEANAIRDMESERMNWCIADVVELIGESGLQSRMGWTGAEPMVVYPQRDPMGDQTLDPAFEAVIRERLDAAACEPGAEGLPPGATGLPIGPDGMPLGPDGLPMGANGLPMGVPGAGPQGGMPAPGGIPNGLHGQRMYPYEVPQVAPKPTPFDQVNPNLSRIPQSYRDDPFFKQQPITRGGPNANAPAPAAAGPNPPPVYVTPPEGNSVLLPQGAAPGAPALLPPGTASQGTLPPQSNPFTPSGTGRNVPTPAPDGQTEEVTDPPLKLDSPEPSDPRSIYGPMTNAPRHAPMQLPPYGQPAPGRYPSQGAPQRPPYGVAPASYGPVGANGGQFVPGGPAAATASAPRMLPPQYSGTQQAAAGYAGAPHDPTLRTPPSSSEIR